MSRRTTEIEASATAGEGRLQTGPVRNWATYDGFKYAPHGSIELRGEMVEMTGWEGPKHERDLGECETGA